MLSGYKTIAFNAVWGLVLLFLVLKPEAEVPTADETRTIVDQVVDHLDAIIAVGANLWLRFVTKTPVFKGTQP